MLAIVSDEANKIDNFVERNSDIDNWLVSRTADENTSLVTAAGAGLSRPIMTHVHVTSDDVK